MYQRNITLKAYYATAFLQIDIAETSSSIFFLSIFETLVFGSSVLMTQEKEVLEKETKK